VKRKRGIASLKWFDLAKKMSGYPLYLYKVRVVGE